MAYIRIAALSLMALAAVPAALAQPHRDQGRPNGGPPAAQQSPRAAPQVHAPSAPRVQAPPQQAPRQVERPRVQQQVERPRIERQVERPRIQQQGERPRIERQAERPRQHGQEQRQVERPRTEPRQVERPSPNIRSVRPGQNEQLRRRDEQQQQARPGRIEEPRRGQTENRQATQSPPQQQLLQQRNNDGATQRALPRDVPAVVVRRNEPSGNGALTGRALQNQAFASLRPRNDRDRALARSTFLGRFADARHRHHHHHHRHGFVIGWVGPLFWPYASYDFVDYTFFPYAYDSFWPVAYDDVYEGMFGRYAYAGAYAAVRQPGAAGVTGGAAIADLCNADAAGLTNWPIAQMEQTLALDEPQRAALAAFRDAAARSLDILRAACPSDLPSTPTGRIAAMRQRLEAMLTAVATVRPALESFYQSLNDEQKARFNALEPADNDPQVRQELTQVCGARAAGIGALPVERIEAAVQPNGAQRNALDDLRGAVSDAVNLLRSDCPSERPLTAVGRLDAMQQRLEAMLQAVKTVQPALEKFYAMLPDEQKERFNRMPPQQQG
jgi:hypothetical protein